MHYDEDGFPIPEETIRWAILRRAFERAFPRQAGRKTFEEKGIRYEREFRKQLSNSRKSWRWMMDFRITHPDGRVELIEDPQGPNRRSDPARNWGLGRE